MPCMHAMLSHVTRIWRAPNSRLARQLRSWRAPTSILARAKSPVGAPSVRLACAKSSFGARQVKFWRAKYVTTKPTPGTVHSPTPGQLHVESIQLACTCALCCCYALCMKREELLIFYSFWLRCFVVMMQYVGFLGRSQLFGSQVKVGAPTWQLARANSRVGAPTAKLARQLGAPTLELARANSGLGARQVPHSSSSFAPFMHSLSLLGISRYHASKATQEGQGEEGDSHVPFVNRPFESEIHGTVNFTQFCCVLLVTWCYRVLLSCYLRPK